MSLYEFCKDPGSLVARERLLFMRTLYEMKLHGACHQVQLLMTEPEIDKDGFDFSVALGYDHLFLQNKVTLSDAGVSSWSIHTDLLAAAWHDRDLAPLANGYKVMFPTGASGGVLLHVIDAEAAKRNELVVADYYFDIFYAAGVAAGAHKAEGFSQDDAARLLSQIQHGTRRIDVPKRAFLPIRSVAAVVALRMHIPAGSNYVSLANSGSDDILAELRSREIRSWMPDD
jgi:hypothetical protein